MIYRSSHLSLLTRAIVNLLDSRYGIDFIWFMNQQSIEPQVRQQAMLAEQQKNRDRRKRHPISTQRVVDLMYQGALCVGHDLADFLSAHEWPARRQLRRIGIVIASQTLEQREITHRPGVGARSSRLFVRLHTRHHVLQIADSAVG